MAKEVRVSTKAADMVKGGGMFDDIDVTIRNPRYTIWERDRGDVTALAIDFEREDEGSFTQHYSAGAKCRLVPSKDGEFLTAEDPDSPPDGINDASSLGVFYTHLDKILPAYADKRDEEGVSCLDGIKVHIKNTIPPGEIEGKPRTPVLCVTKVYGAKTTSKKGNSEAAADEEEHETAGEDDMEARVEEVVVALLKKAKGGPLKRAELMTGVNKAFDASERREAVEVFVTPSFLKDKARPWSYEGNALELK